MTIIKNIGNLSANFSIIDNETINDSRLSHKAIGIWLRLVSKNTDWTISVSGLVALYPEDKYDSVVSGLKELCKYGYLIREAPERDNGKFTHVTMVLCHRPLSNEVLSDEQINFLFSKKVSCGDYTEDEFKKMFPERVSRYGVSGPGNPPLQRIEELNKYNSLTNAGARENREIRTSRALTSDEPHRLGTLPKKHIPAAKDGLPSIELSAMEIDALTKTALESSIPIAEARTLVNETIVAYRLECGSNQAMHEKPYWAILKWLNKSIKDFKNKVNKPNVQIKERGWKKEPRVPPRILKPSEVWPD